MNYIGVVWLSKGNRGPIIISRHEIKMRPTNMVSHFSWTTVRPQNRDSE